MFRFYEELNRFLPPGQRKQGLEVRLEEGTTVRQAIRDMGVSLGEVDLVLVNGEPAGFESVLNDGDRVSVYPEFERLDVGGVTGLPGRPLRSPKFVADRDLGPLAQYLRGLDLDVRFDPSLSGSDLVHISLEEKRILLSRDPELVSGDRVERAILLRRSGPVEALAGDVLQALDLDAESEG